MTTLATRRALLLGAGATATAAGLPGIAAAKAPMAKTQAPGFYRFKIGDFQATVVSDGPLNLGPPSGEVFKDVSREDMTRALTANYLPADAVALEQNALVVNTGGRLVLFDTGTGPTVKAFGPDAGRLPTNLKAAGIDPRQIDAIAITHAHPDHCFGLMGDRNRRNFPNAQIYLAQADLDFWTDESKATNDMFKMMIGGARAQLLPNRDRIVFVKDGQDIVPGIRAMATPGHTVGHMAYMITSQGQSLCNIGDAAHHHVISMERPRAEFAFDTDGKQAVASRLRLFDMLSSSRTQLIAYHFPWPGIGYIARQPIGYRYYPAAMRMVL